MDSCHVTVTSNNGKSESKCHHSIPSTTRQLPEVVLSPPSAFTRLFIFTGTAVAHSRYWDREMMTTLPATG